MKRKSANQIIFPQPIRTIKRNRSCLLNQLAFNRFNKEKNRGRAAEFTSAAAIVDLLINEWLHSLDQHLRASDQRKYYQSMLDTVDDTAAALLNMLNPLPLPQTHRNTATADPEPQTASGDMMCGGNSIACEGKSVRTPRISILMGLEGECRAEKSQLLTSKANLSSKCLIKLPKEQFQDRKQGLEALKDVQIEKRDAFEEMLREKLSKDKKNIYFNQEKLETITKQNTLPSIEEYTFDYDGSLFPLKKNSIQNAHRIKILNTTCKVINRDFIQNRKQSIISKLHGAHLKTEMQENEKENKRYGEGQRRNLSQRKQSATDSMKELVRICTESDELAFKAKIEESIGSKSVKIREIKAH